jgi:hypothetical protein
MKSFFWLWLKKSGPMVAIDAAGLITFKQMGRPVSPKSPAKLAKIIEQVNVP